MESVGFMQALELPKQSYMRRKKINPVAKPESNPSASTSPPRDPSDAQSPTMKTEETSVRPAQVNILTMLLFLI